MRDKEIEEWGKAGKECGKEEGRVLRRFGKRGLGELGVSE